MTLIRETISGPKVDPELDEFGKQFESLLVQLESVVEIIKLTQKKSGDYIGLSNAGIFLDTFGHILIGWMWLKQAAVVFKNLKKRWSKSVLSRKKSCDKILFWP